MKNEENIEQSSVKERLKAFIEYINISQSEFEKRTKLSNGYVNNIRKSIKSEKFDENIAPVFPQLNKIWLLHGTGEMLLDNSVSDKTPKQYSIRDEELILVRERLSLYEEKIDFYKEKIEQLEEENERLKKVQKPDLPGERVSTAK